MLSYELFHNPPWYKPQGFIYIWYYNIMELGYVWFVGIYGVWYLNIAYKILEIFFSYFSWMEGCYIPSKIKFLCLSWYWNRHSIY